MPLLNRLGSKLVECGAVAVGSWVPGRSGRIFWLTCPPQSQAIYHHDIQCYVAAKCHLSQSQLIVPQFTFVVKARSIRGKNNAIQIASGDSAL